MEIRKERYEKQLFVIGIIEICFGILLMGLFFDTMSKLNNNYVLLVPTWQFVTPTVALFILQLAQGISAIGFRKSTKVKYCIYIAAASLICIIFLKLVESTVQETNIIMMILPFIVPIFYLHAAIKLNTYYKGILSDKNIENMR